MTYGTCIEAIRDAQSTLLANYPEVIIFGLGVSDPKAIFGSTQGLQNEFGPERVFDVPLSENALMGVSTGLALGGYRPIFIHQRFDFFLLAMDQLVNGAAKWHMMFGGESNLPLVIRLIVGRGWGQGPTHSQCFHSWLAHIPGLKIVMPFTPEDAKGLLIEATLDPNPVIFIEHRWLHQSEGEFPSKEYRIEIGKARIARIGTDITIVAMSLMVAEALKAADELERFCGVSAEVIDLRSIKPLDWQTIEASVQKTKHLIVADIGHGFASVASEIISHIAQNQSVTLSQRPIKVSTPDLATPTSHFMTKNYYPDAKTLISCVCKSLGVLKNTTVQTDDIVPHDVPDESFTGPF